jgi:hypothetical protein
MAKEGEHTGMKTVRDRMEAALNHESGMGDDRIVLFDRKLRENLLKSSSGQWRSLSIVITTLAVWAVIAAQGVETIDFLGMTFKNLAIPLVVIPPIAAFFYYQYQLFDLNSRMLHTAIRVCQEHLFMPFSKYFVDELTLYDSGFSDIENELDIMEPRSSFMKKISGAWILLSWFVAGLFPLGMFSYIIYWLLSSPIVDRPWAIVSVILIVVLVARSIMIFVFSLGEKSERERQIDLRKQMYTNEDEVKEWLG